MSDPRHIRRPKALAGDGHDASGNTTSLDGATLAYDHANRLVGKNGGAAIPI